jgi:signal transduction histidine kinase
MVKITVKDTGTGIEESVIPKLFNLFSTFEIRKGTNTHGVGLGLFICS